MESLLGEIRMFAGNFAPRGWAICDGQLLSIAQHQALFSILGTIYGGDGRTTFALPDLRGRVAVGEGQGPGLSAYRLGAKSGTETVTLDVSQLPAHNHAIGANSGGGNDASPSNAVSAEGGEDIYHNQPNANMQPTGSAGGSQPHENRQPYQVIHYIICMEGVYPSRS